MNNRERAASVADLVRTFAAKQEVYDEPPAVVAAKMIAGILHWTMRESEMAGDDGRKPALAATRAGLTSFIDDVHRSPANTSPSCYTLITVRTDGGLWVSETGFEDMIQ